MSHPPSWRLLADGDHRGARNMAVDRALLESLGAGGPPTLRLYGWQPPCLSLGQHQGPEAADLAFCRDHGIDVVRRPTGGRAVLHHHELTYSVVAPVGVEPLPRGLQEAYRRLCAALVRGCHRLGVAAELTGGEVNLTLPGPRTTVPCFKAPAGGEVVVGGRKLIGSAMRAHGGAILQHGAMLLDWDGDLQAGSMGLADDGGLRPHVTTFADQLGRPLSPSALATAMVAAFTEELGVELVAAGLSAAEAARAEVLEGALASL